MNDPASRAAPRPRFVFRGRSRHGSLWSFSTCVVARIFLARDPVGITALREAGSRRYLRILLGAQAGSRPKPEGTAQRCL